MPKRLHEIKNFHVGTVTTPVDTDVPEDSATYSLNIDPMAEDGVLKGIPFDQIRNLVTNGSDSSPADGAVASGTSIITLDDSSSFAASGSVIFEDSLGKTQLLTYSGNSGGTERLTGVSGWVGAGTLEDNTIVYESTGATYIANQASMINNNGTRHIVYWQDSDSKIKKIDDLYEKPESPIKHYISTSAESHTGTPTMVKNNKEVHIGMGNGASDKPLWCGFENQGQFGEAVSTSLTLQDAELHSPTTFPSFHKTVEYGNYIYGISFDGTYLYYIDKSTSDYNIYVSNLTFTKTKALALDHNNYLMIVDDNNTIVWVNVSSTDHSVARTYGITQAGTETSHDFTDIIETGASSTWYIWLAKSGGHTFHGAGQVNAPTGVTGRGLLQNATAPTGTAGTLTFTDRTPHQGIKSSLWGSYVHQVGHWYDSNATNQATAPSHSYPANAAIVPYTKASLIKANDTNWVGWICEFVCADNQTFRLGINCLINGTTSSAVPHQVVDMNGPVLNFVKNDYAPVYSGTYADNDVDETKWFPVRLKTGSASTDIIGKYGDDADITNATLQTTWDNITSIYSHDSGHIADDRIIIGVNTANSGGIVSHDTKLMHLKYIDPTPTVSGGATMASSHWYCTSDGFSSHNSDESVYRFATGGASVPTFEYTTDQAKVQDAIISSNDTGFTYDLYLNSGYGNGKIATISSASTSAFSSWTRRQEAPLDISLDQTNMETNSSYSASKEYWYKASFIYDGYQESPLGIATQLVNPVAKNVEVTMNLYTESLSSRVTGVALYRAESSSDGATEPTGFYRLVEAYDLDVSWKYSTDATWGVTRTKTIIDNFKLGASYEARTGISEVLDHTIPNYSLSTDLNSHLFVAKCHHQLIKDANNFLFKSKAYNYDQFNWINDFLILPTTPTALKSFNGRLWAFDENNMHRVEPNNLYIEDSIEGVGCLSQDSICVSDYGMCFADKDNIYLHDGVKASPISIAISRGDSTYSWEKADTSYSPKIVFYNKMKSFVILFKTTSGLYSTWAFNVVKKRWDLWRNFMISGGSQNTNEPLSLILGKNGEIIASCADKMWILMNDPTNVKPWDWESKQITLGQDTQIKRFNNFNVTGSPSGSLGNDSTGITVKIDGSATTESGSLTAFTVATNEASGKKLQWLLKGQTGTVDALGTVYRRKIVTSEQ